MYVNILYLKAAASAAGPQLVYAQERSWDAQECPRDAQERPRDAPERSWDAKERCCDAATRMHAILIHYLNTAGSVQLSCSLASLSRCPDR